MNGVLNRFYNSHYQSLSSTQDKKETLFDYPIFEKNVNKLLEGVDKGFGKITYGDPSFELKQNLRQSAVYFAANKTFLQCQELVDLLINPDGTIRSWSDFQTAAKPLVGKYNQQWLKTEYDAVVRSARSARDYRQAQESIAEYPNLKYLPSVSANPRDSHKALYGIVRPVNDAFWITNLPPSDWECKCSVEPTIEEVSDLPAEIPAAAEAFTNNPALTGKVFSEDHPYFQKVGKDATHDAIILENMSTYVENNATRQLMNKTISNGVTQVKFDIEGIRAAIDEPNTQPIKKLLLINNYKDLNAAFYSSAFENEHNGQQFYSFAMGDQTNYFVINSEKYLVNILNSINAI